MTDVNGGQVKRSDTGMNEILITCHIAVIAQQDPKARETASNGIV